MVPEVAVVDSPRQLHTAWPTFAAAAAADWSRVVVVAALVVGLHMAAVVDAAAHLNMVVAVAAAVDRACRVGIPDRMIPRMDQWAVVDG